MNKKRADNTVPPLDSNDDGLQLYAGSVSDRGDSMTLVFSETNDGKPEVEKLWMVEEVLDYCKQHEKVLFFIAANDPEKAIEDVSDFYVWFMRGGVDALLQ